MIYTVKIDGVTVFDEDQERTLESPECEMEMNAPGSFSFVMYPDHEYYDTPKLLTSDVEIWENNEIIWFGRIIKIETGFLNAKKIECEGALGYFNDSIQRPREFNDGMFSIVDFLEYLITNHNSQVPANRQFTIGKIEIDNKFVYRKLDYNSTIDCLTTMCVGAEGGYLVPRREGNKNYLDWFKNPPLTGSQPAQFALNITDLSQILDGTEIKTAIIPLGEADDNGDRVNIYDVNNGYDYLTTPAAEKYGLISQVVEFSGLTKAADVILAGQKWIQDKQFDELSIEVNVADLSYIDENYEAFRLGQNIHCTSTPNLIDKNLPIVKMRLNLASAEKNITIGTIKKQELTEIYKEDSSTSGRSGGTSSSGSSGGSSGGGATAKVNNGALTINVNGDRVGYFTANSKTGEDVDIFIPLAETEDIDFEKELAEEVEA